MKKTRKYSKKGFTLVELIVVLVILAVMAAMLVPALTGYIDEARKKKDYNAASEVLTGAQAVVAEYYGNPGTNVDANGNPTPALAATYVNAHKDRVTTLTGFAMNGTTNDITVTTVDGNFNITAMTVTINGNDYTWDGTTNQWT